jgi:regulator of protease activity HflC (stomatin/prohibitin superfamily)
MKVQSIQKTQQRENEVAQSKAEADKKIAEARGEAESRLLIAKAEAEAIELRGKALRSNPEIIRLNEIERWNGVLPTTMIPNAAIPVISK